MTSGSRLATWQPIGLMQSYCTPKHELADRTACTGCGLLSCRLCQRLHAPPHVALLPCQRGRCVLATPAPVLLARALAAAMGRCFHRAGLLVEAWILLLRNPHLQTTPSYRLRTLAQTSLPWGMRAACLQSCRFQRLLDGAGVHGLPLDLPLTQVVSATVSAVTPLCC